MGDSEAQPHPIVGVHGQLSRSNSFDTLDCGLPGSSVHGMSQQGYWSRGPLPPPGRLPAQETSLQPVLCVSAALGGGVFFTREPSEKLSHLISSVKRK